MTNRRTYTAEFKRDAVRLAQSTENITSAGRDLGTLLPALRKWLKAAQDTGEQASPGQGRPALSAEQQQLKRLRKEDEIPCQKRELLKKAAAFLSRAAPVFLVRAAPMRTLDRLSRTARLGTLARMKTLARFFARETTR